MLPVLVAILTSAVQVTNADIELLVSGSDVSVRAEYRFADDVGGVVLQSIRLPAGNLVSLAASVDLSTQRLPGLTEWRGVADDGVILVEYRVTGHEARIPLIIPTYPTMPGETDVLIAIHGLSPDLPLVDGFPRMTRDEEGTVISTPANLPSFVMLPDMRRISVAGAADAVVLGAIGLISLFWLIRRRRQSAA